MNNEEKPGMPSGADLDAHDAERRIAEAAKPKPPMPVCPYCGLDPCIPDMLESTYGMFLAKVFICSNRECRKLFNVELIGTRDPRVIQR